MEIRNLHIENFTVFDNQDIEFCPGINIFIGANGTGKSHLLKTLYSFVQTIAGDKKNKTENGEEYRIFQLLAGVFKPEDNKLEKLIRAEDKNVPAILKLNSDRGGHSVEISRKFSHVIGDASQPGLAPKDAAGLFVPPNEVLSIYPGFTASYEKRELAFDQTNYDICKALSAQPLKKMDPDLMGLLARLEGILRGKVVQKGRYFYLRNEKTEKTLEAHLMAEGHRKLATLVYLIKNGSIEKNTTLFWDEPEANLNPQLIKTVALFLRELARIGVQIFIATHDYLLTGELSIAAEYSLTPRIPTRFFTLARKDDGPVQIQSGDTLADLQDNPILDEFAAHYEREHQAAVKQMRKKSKNGDAC